MHRGQAMTPAQWLKLGLIGAILAGVGAFGFHAGSASVQAKWDAAELKRDKETLEQTNENTRIGNRWRDNVAAATSSAQARATAVRRDVDGVALERDLFRDALAELNSKLPDATADACRERAATLSLVYEQCVGALEDVAGRADRHASDSLMYQEAWPKATPASAPVSP